MGTQTLCACQGVAIANDVQRVRCGALRKRRHVAWFVGREEVVFKQARFLKKFDDFRAQFPWEAFHESARTLPRQYLPRFCEICGDWVRRCADDCFQNTFANIGEKCVDCQVMNSHLLCNCTCVDRVVRCVYENLQNFKLLD
ncbi:MAG: hypothetical protein C0445_02010 [Polaromonas sp.]|nr:hypothetical protein [Polaromonas sp.]